jgi:hypothetical protein
MMYSIVVCYTHIHIRIYIDGVHVRHVQQEQDKAELHITDAGYDVYCILHYPVDNMLQVVAYRVQQRLSEMQQDRQASTSSIYHSSAGMSAGMSASEHGVKGSSNNVTNSSSNNNNAVTTKEPLCLPVLELSQAKGLAKQLGCDPKVIHTYRTEPTLYIYLYTTVNLH